MDEAPTPRPGQARAGALRRAALVKRWVAGGAVALTGIFFAVAAHALPASHSKHRASAAAPSSPAAVSPDLGDEGSAPQQSIAPPAAAPQASSADPGAVSGGS
ncbi:MAG TPA: hypothetical protein VFL87_03780 [Thermoleophilaceae bacterium]|nr:hypothetical protein [Thermoleophilaceae bacterium]